MIYAHIDDAGNYGGLGEVFAWAVRQLARADLKDLPAGRTELIPGKAWFSIDEPETKPLEQALFEAHREFVDVQMTIAGDELIGCAPLGRVTPLGEYDEKRDIQFFRGEGLVLDCTGGMFAVFFPEDAHRPCVAPGTPRRIRKIVAKIHRSLIPHGQLP